MPTLQLEQDQSVNQLNDAMYANTTYVASIEPELVHEAQLVIDGPDYDEVPDADKRRYLVDRLATFVATEGEAKMHMGALQKHVEKAPKERLEAYAGALALLDRSGYLDNVSVQGSAAKLHRRTKTVLEMMEGSSKGFTESANARSVLERLRSVARFSFQVYTNPVTKDSVGRKS